MMMKNQTFNSLIGMLDKLVLSAMLNMPELLLPDLLLTMMISS